MQQQIAVDPLCLGQIGIVAVDAADLLEVLFACGGAGGLGRGGGHHFPGPRQRGNEGRHLIALLVREIESAGTILWLRQRCRLGLQGIAQPQLVGARDPHELGQVSDVGLPTEFSDSLAGQLRGAPGGSLLAIHNRQAERQALIALVGQDGRVRNRVDDARAEERRCIALANVDFGDSGNSDVLAAGRRIGGLG